MMETNQLGPKGVTCPTCQRFTLEGNIQSNLLEIPQTLENGKGDAEYGKICCKHHGQHIEYICKKCNKLGCAKCIVDDHNGHETESIEEALDTIVTNTRKCLDVVIQHKEEVKKQIMKLEKFRQQYTYDLNRKRKLIQDHIAKVKDGSAHLLELVNNNAKTTLAELDITKIVFECELANLESFICWTKTVLNMKIGLRLLCELMLGLYQRVKNCAKQRVTMDINERMHLANNWNLLG